MMHYVCAGDCGGEAERPGVCESGGCSKEGQPLAECDCGDGIHKGVARVAEDPDIESMDDEDNL